MKVTGSLLEKAHERLRVGAVEDLTQQEVDALVETLDLTTSRDEIISIMANAIAFELEGEGDIKMAEMVKYIRAAERAYRQGIEGKNE